MSKPRNTMEDCISEVYHTEPLGQGHEGILGPDGKRGDGSLHITITAGLSEIAERGELRADRWPQIVLLQELNLSANERRPERTVGSLDWPPDGKAWATAMAEWDAGHPTPRGAMAGVACQLDTGGNGREISVDIAKLGAGQGPIYIVELAQWVRAMRKEELDGSPGLVLPGDMTSPQGSTMEIDALTWDGTNWLTEPVARKSNDSHNGTDILILLQLAAVMGPAGTEDGVLGLAYRCHGSGDAGDLNQHAVHGHARWRDGELECLTRIRMAIRHNIADAAATAANIMGSAWCLGYRDVAELRWRAHQPTN